MKKILVICVLGAVALVIALVAALFYLGPIVKAGVEKVGPQVAKVPVKLDGASISILNGNGELKGFVLGNPPGFKTPEAMKVGRVAVSLVPKSFTANKIIIHSVRIEAPEITYEAGFGGSNIGKLLENMQTTASQEKSGGTNTASKGLQVDEFVIAGAKLHVAATMLGGTSAALPLPDIRLAALGQGPEGITAAELSSKAFGAIVEAAGKAVAASAVSQSLGLDPSRLGVESKDRTKKLESAVTDLLKSKK